MAAIVSEDLSIKCNKFIQVCDNKISGNLENLCLFVDRLGSQCQRPAFSVARRPVIGQCRDAGPTSSLRRFRASRWVQNQVMLINGHAGKSENFVSQSKERRTKHKRLFSVDVKNLPSAIVM